MPLSTMKPTRMASPRMAWLVENAHTTVTPSAVVMTIATRNMVHMCRRAAGCSTRNRAAAVCSSPDLKRAQQTSTAGIISRISRIHSTVAMLLRYYLLPVEVVPSAVEVEAAVLLPLRFSCERSGRSVQRSMKGVHRDPGGSRPVLPQRAKRTAAPALRSDVAQWPLAMVMVGSMRVMGTRQWVGSRRSERCR